MIEQIGASVPKTASELRSAIIKAQTIRREAVHVPEWGVTVWVRTLTGSERDAFEAEQLQTKGRRMRVDLRNLRAKLLVRCLESEDGTPIFASFDADVVGKQSAAVLDRLYTIAQRLSAVSAEDEEELGKASASDQSAGSGSISLLQ